MLSTLVAISLLTTPLQDQPTADQVAPKPDVDRLSIQLRRPALLVWQDLKRTRTNQYQFLRDAADLWTFVFTCPEIDQKLARDFTPIDQYSEYLIGSIVGTYFDEEWQQLDRLSKAEQQEIFDDLAQSLYLFELGQKTVESPTRSANVDAAQRKICQESQSSYRDKFIQLKRTAVLKLRDIEARR